MADFVHMILTMTKTLIYSINLVLVLVEISDN